MISKFRLIHLFQMSKVLGKQKDRNEYDENKRIIEYCIQQQFNEFEKTGYIKKEKVNNFTDEEKGKISTCNLPKTVKNKIMGANDGE